MNIEKVKEALERASCLYRGIGKDDSLIKEAIAEIEKPPFDSEDKQGRYDNPVAELEKPGESLEAVEKWAEGYYGHSVLVGDIHRSLAVAFTSFAASYHAKKCAECARVPPKCLLCGDPIIVGVCENCAPGKI